MATPPPRRAGLLGGQGQPRQGEVRGGEVHVHRSMEGPRQEEIAEGPLSPEASHVVIPFLLEREPRRDKGAIPRDFQHRSVQGTGADVEGGPRGGKEGSHREGGRTATGVQGRDGRVEGEDQEGGGRCSSIEGADGLGHYRVQGQAWSGSPSGAAPRSRSSPIPPAPRHGFGRWGRANRPFFRRGCSCTLPRICGRVCRGIRAPSLSHAIVVSRRPAAAAIWWASRRRAPPAAAGLDRAAARR
mmetsp:Transcript_53235/g.159375  ORF Transcript_53235/g.159375 Transcript_53235/m.159375 type:complete len:243 (+) Transcript_53235:553-1281(+)